jgi:hypothetical protein
MVKLEENREKKPRINRKVELMLEEIVDTEKKYVITLNAIVEVSTEISIIYFLIITKYLFGLPQGNTTSDFRSFF